jgi:hypothetical protein
MASSWLCSSAILLVLAACAPDPRPGARVALRESAEVAGENPLLRLRLQIEPSPTILAALEHGIPLTLELSLASARRGGEAIVRRWRLERSPLLDRYLLSEEGTGTRRSFAHRNALLAALERQEFALAPELEGPLLLRLRLVREALPPPLQLPALLDSHWRLAARFVLERGRSAP